jgi:hypothetical protein
MRSAATRLTKPLTAPTPSPQERDDARVPPDLDRDRPLDRRWPPEERRLDDEDDPPRPLVDDRPRELEDRPRELEDDLPRELEEDDRPRLPDVERLPPRELD